jgi:hypothetical protein
MPEDLVNKLIADIEKTGFPLELRVGQLLQERGYYVANNVYFLDRDEGKGREVDLRALFNFFFKTGSQASAVRHCLLIECKKSKSRPWVFFVSPRVGYDGDVSNFLSHGASPGWPAAGGEKPYDELNARHPWISHEARGRSFYEAFSAGSAESNAAIQRSILASIKASIDVHEARFAGKYDDRNVIFYLPMIVLEGELFAAKLKPEGLIVDSVGEVAVSVHYTSNQYEHQSHERHTVLVVRESALASALSNLETWLKETCAPFFRRHPEYFEVPEKKNKSDHRMRKS